MTLNFFLPHLLNIFKIMKKNDAFGKPCTKTNVGIFRLVDTSMKQLINKAKTIII